MKASIDNAGRLVIPKQLRDRLGLVPGEVDVEADGADLRVRPVAQDTLAEEDGWLLVPSSGTPLTDDDVQQLSDADQR
ncbi:AbrB/MazE/SpoVT family DNA-binding domain-containing protein [Pseudonocardia sp. ICBG1142]|uniref:AbrB/MazE/SpoVT family DNA-binding domain-containing protein n=1 Tax=Pseudonocardia sp. ICBG1142 TaxID=2846760 RepID=UPI001CF6BC80|nr:AbrB/MazE/SpoVT family DNA-binding domain-containing protein [Pseudonocardia sp. ICBG1142]